MDFPKKGKFQALGEFFQRESVISVVIFITITLWFGFWAHIGMDPHHDGIMLKPAYDVATGHMLFRDSFTQYGALTTLFQAGACVLFGTKILTIRLLTVLFYAGSTVLVWHIGKRILTGYFRIIPLFLILLLPPFYFFNLIPWSSIYALFFLLLTVLMFQLGVETRREDWFWTLTGAISILPFWCRQPLGLVFLGGILLVIATHWRFYDSWMDTTKRLFLFIAGAVAVCGIFFIWLSLNHAVVDFWKQSIEYAFGFAFRRTACLTSPIAATSTHIPAFIIVLGKFFQLFFLNRIFWSFTISTILVSWFFYLVGRGIYRRNLSMNHWFLLPVVLMAGISLHQYYPVPGLRHYYWGAFPAFLVIARTLQTMLLSRGQELWIRILKLCVACTIVGTLTYDTSLIYKTSDRSLGALPSIYDLSKLVVMDGNVPDEVKGMWVLPWEKKVWEDLKALADSLPENQRNAQVVNLTPHSLFIFAFPNKTNWDKMHVDWGDGVYSDYHVKRALATLSGKFTLLVMVGVEDKKAKRQFSDKEIEEDEMKALEQYLFDNAKVGLKDKQEVFYPEYKNVGYVRYRYWHRYQYGVMVLAPTGKKIYRDRDEVLDNKEENSKDGKAKKESGKATESEIPLSDKKASPSSDTSSDGKKVIKKV